MQTCPVCRGSDRTESVSAVVGSQTVIGNNIGNIIGVAYVPNGITPGSWHQPDGHERPIISPL